MGGLGAQLEMNYGAEADLKIILRAGIERGANVIGFGAERDARSVCPIDAAAELQREAVLAFTSDLGIQVNAADKDMSPRREALARSTQTDTAAAGIKNIFRAFAANLATPGGDDVALQTDKGIQVVGKVGVQAAEVCGELRRIEMDVFVAYSEIPAIAFLVKAR